MTERDRLLKHVQMCDFVLYDTALYLDTHPGDQQAMAHYKRHLMKRDEAKKAYTAKYGPLCHNDCGSEDRWTWTDGPWPWQNKEV